jgi:hypothetical protein
MKTFSLFLLSPASFWHNNLWQPKQAVSESVTLSFSSLVLLSIFKVHNRVFQPQERSGHCNEHKPLSGPQQGTENTIVNKRGRNPVLSPVLVNTACAYCNLGLQPFLFLKETTLSVITALKVPVLGSQPSWSYFLEMWLYHLSSCFMYCWSNTPDQLLKFWLCPIRSPPFLTILG